MDRALPLSLRDGALSGSESREESLALAETLVPSTADPEQVREAARIFAAQNRPERAIETLRQGILTHPRQADLLVLLGDLLSRSGAHDEAGLYLRQAVELEPQSADASFRLGLHHARRGHAEAARASYETTVRLDPAHVRAWVNLGLTRSDLGERKSAIDALQRAVNLDPASSAMPHSA